MAWRFEVVYKERHDIHTDQSIPSRLRLSWYRNQVAYTFVLPLLPLNTNSKLALSSLGAARGRSKLGVRSKRRIPSTCLSVLTSSPSATQSISSFLPFGEWATCKRSNANLFLNTYITRHTSVYRPQPHLATQPNTTMHLRLIPLVTLPLLLLTATLTKALPLGPAEDIIKTTLDSTGSTEAELFPQWSNPSSWMGFRMVGAHVSSLHPPHLSAEYNADWHVVNSPIRGVVTDNRARLRLGITSREVDRDWEQRVLNRHQPSDTLRTPELQAIVTEFPTHLGNGQQEGSSLAHARFEFSSPPPSTSSGVGRKERGRRRRRPK